MCVYMYTGILCVDKTVNITEEVVNLLGKDKRGVGGVGVEMMCYSFKV